jgi:hypothetical protein
MKQSIARKFYNASEGLSMALSELICTTFSVASIEELHLSINSRVLERGTDQSTAIHKLIYLDFDMGNASRLLPHYYALLREWCRDLIKDSRVTDWALQRYPSVRVQFPDNVSVFEFHRDSDYAHPLGEINHFLAVTQCSSTAALHVEENLGWEDYVPLNLIKNQSAILNTSIYKHGDKVNAENYTRVSLDFRAIPEKALQTATPLASITQGRLFDTNNYFIPLREIPLIPE